MKIMTVLIVIVLLSLTAVAHPGKTDRYGGHRCIKACAEWDLYHSQYHLHDKNGKPVKVARKKPVTSKPRAAPVEEKAVVEEGPQDGLAAIKPTPPVAVAAAITVEPTTASLPWILLMLFLLLFLIVRRNRRKSSDRG